MWGREITTEKSIPNPPACDMVEAPLFFPCMHLSVQSYPYLTFRCEIPPLAFTYVIVLYVYVQGTINISSTGINAFENLF